MHTIGFWPLFHDITHPLHLGSDVLIFTYKFLDTTPILVQNKDEPQLNTFLSQRNPPKN